MFYFNLPVFRLNSTQPTIQFVQVLINTVVLQNDALNLEVERQKIPFVLFVDDMICLFPHRVEQQKQKPQPKQNVVPILDVIDLKPLKNKSFIIEIQTINFKGETFCFNL